MKHLRVLRGDGPAITVLVVLITVSSCLAAVKTVQIRPTVRPAGKENPTTTGNLDSRQWWINLQLLPDREYESAQVSPDGQTVVIEHSNHEGCGTSGTTWSASLYDVETRRQWDLADSVGCQIHPGQWSPGQEWFSFGHDEEWSDPAVAVTNRTGLVRILLDPKRLWALTGFGAMNVHAGGWSPDGKAFIWNAYCYENNETDSFVGTVDLNGRIPFYLGCTRLSNLIHRQDPSAAWGIWEPIDAVWSPTGSAVAVPFSDERGGRVRSSKATKWGLLLVDARGRNARSRRWPAEGGEFRWSRDGKTLLVTLGGPHPSQFALGAGTLQTTAWPMPDEPLLVKRKQPLDGQNWHWVWSLVDPSRHTRQHVLEASPTDAVTFAGLAVAVVDAGSDHSLYLTDLGTGGRRLLHRGPAYYLIAANPRYVAWMPVTKRYDFLADGPLNVVELSTGSHQEVVLPYGTGWSEMAWQPSGRQLLLRPRASPRGVLLLEFR